MPSLDWIRVRGFKSIREADIDLNPEINVLIGPNGSGKSNLITLFRLINAMGRSQLQNFVAQSGGADALLHYGKKTTKAIELQLKFGSNLYAARLAPSDQDQLFFAHEQCNFSGPGYNAPFDIELGKGHLESGLPIEIKSHPGGIAQHVLSSISSWQVYHFHDTSPSARVKQTGSVADNEYLQPDAGNLAAFLLRLKEEFESNYEDILRTLRAAAPFFGDFVLTPRRISNGDETIQLRWKEKTGDRVFPPAALSDGTLRFICLSTALLQPNVLRPAALLIDEPELGLHPKAIVILVELMRIAAKHTQILVSTQSVPLVN